MVGKEGVGPHPQIYPSYPPPQNRAYPLPSLRMGGLQANSGGVSRVGALPLPQVRVRTEACARPARAVPKTGTLRRRASHFYFTQRRQPSRGPPTRGRTCGPHTTTALQAALRHACTRQNPRRTAPTPSGHPMDSMTHPCDKLNYPYISMNYTHQRCLDTLKPHHYVARDFKGVPKSSGKAGRGERADGKTAR